MRVAIICSSGGAAMSEAIDARRDVEFFLITDRACGAERAADERNVRRQRIDAPSNDDFSRQAVEALRAAGAFDLVIMFYARLVTAPLLSAYPVLNIHPALLPSFKGLSGVRQAHRAGVRVFGATLHLAVPDVDAGPIIAQAWQSVGPGDELRTLERRSFVHKVALFLLAIDLIERGELVLPSPSDAPGWRPTIARPPGEGINPGLSLRDIESVRALQRREGIGYL